MNSKQINFLKSLWRTEVVFKSFNAHGKVSRGKKGYKTKSNFSEYSLVGPTHTHTHACTHAHTHAQQEWINTSKKSLDLPLPLTHSYHWISDSGSGIWRGLARLPAKPLACGGCSLSGSGLGCSDLYISSWLVTEAREGSWTAACSPVTLRCWLVCPVRSCSPCLRQMAPDHGAQSRTNLREALNGGIWNTAEHLGQFQWVDMNI